LAWSQFWDGKGNDFIETKNINPKIFLVHNLLALTVFKIGANGAGIPLPLGRRG
jgi:hypothetical protein